MARILFLGVIVGLGAAAVWAVVAPSVPTLVAEQGMATVPGESTAVFDAVMYFAGITVIAGIVLGIGAWLVVAVRGPLAVVMLAASAGLGSWIAATVGTLLAGLRNQDPVPAGDLMMVSVPPEMSLWQALLIQPLVAVFVYFLAAGMSDDPGLGVEARSQRRRETVSA
ncbi:hypothetical protein HT102_07370 [Hoyosella sp. G463]|uniref:DUF2567 domain-containing protein n=1 Tax=Lolliginicoccus lacisalsi TaxID=2742202 RepID=A0A927PL13_9ACTN|nr:hypothetical protein [Lolliginicoccus lacisalsi]MBD8506298.1 hypothetical protein [Lolliginicoccus lacisalsi]